MKTKKVYVYQATLSNHFKQAWTIIFPASLLWLMPLIFYYSFGVESVGFAIKGALFLFVPVFVVHSILHIRYWSVSKRKTLSFDEKNRLIVFDEGKGERHYSVRDIERVSTVVTYSKLENQLRWFPWDSYFYSQILFESGDSILVTSLLVPELMWPIMMPKEVITAEIYCWPNQGV